MTTTCLLNNLGLYGVCQGECEVLGSAGQHACFRLDMYRSAGYGCPSCPWLAKGETDFSFATIRA